MEKERLVSSKSIVSFYRDRDNLFNISAIKMGEEDRYWLYMHAFCIYLGLCLNSPINGCRWLCPKGG